MEPISSNAETGVQVPTFPMASGEIARLIDLSGTLLPTSTDEYGEYFAMSLVRVTPYGAVLPESTIVVPLAEAGEEEVFDLTFLAKSPLMFVRLHDCPQPLRTYGRCVAYSTGVVERPLAIGAMIRFPTIPQFIVAKRDLEVAVRDNRGFDAGGAPESFPEKRQCVRPLGEDGELGDDTGSRVKGSSTFVLDLDGVKHPTRNKTDLSLRERELSFLLRAMDSKRREYSVASDVSLQTEVYRRMLCEQSDTQADDRKEAFMSCGLLSRVQRLQIFTKTEKLKLLLMGCILLEGSSEPTLSLEDFTTTDRISTRSSPCPNNNAGLVSVLKNLQIVMQITFSEFFESCLGAFINHLEGAFRPLELVAADFLKHSVELTLRRVFRVIRIDKGSSMEGFSVANPELCAQLLITSFDKLAEDLADHHTMSKQDAYFRVQQSRKNDTLAAAARAEPLVPKVVRPVIKFADSVKEETTSEPGPSKVCSGHFGKQISAVRKDGRPYSCKFIKGCTFVHISIVGMSEGAMIEVASQMPSPIKRDFLSAIHARKK